MAARLSLRTFYEGFHGAPQGFAKAPQGPGEAEEQGERSKPQKILNQEELWRDRPAPVGCKVIETLGRGCPTFSVSGACGLGSLPGPNPARESGLRDDNAASPQKREFCSKGQKSIFPSSTQVRCQVTLPFQVPRSLQQPSALKSKKSRSLPVGDSLGLQFTDSVPQADIADGIPSPVRSPPDIGQMPPYFLMSFLGACSPGPPG